MSLLRPLESEDAQSLRAIISAKHQPRRTRLRILKPKILSRYRSYARNRRSLNRLRLSRFNADQQADCLDCYDNETVALAILKRQIISNLPKRWRFYCCFCGLIPWRTFDHFLPKNKFPEFSVLARNLVPCCWQCNHTKGSKWNNAQSILNPYYDPWPQKQHLKAEVDFDEDAGASVSYQIHKSPTGSISHARLKMHYERLQLIERYNEAGATAITEIKSTLNQAQLQNRGQVRQRLIEEANGLKDLYGANHWRVILLIGLADCKRFLESVLD